MDKDLIALLKSNHPSDRMRGIDRLVSENHPDARRILGALYKKETDESVKEYIQAAARRLKQAEAQSAPASSSKTKRDPAQAQKYLEGAMTALIDLRNDEAWTLAAQAFRADPSLAEDDYATGLAGEITGLERQEAVEALLSTVPETTGGGKAKNQEKAKVSDVEKVGWGRALGGIALYSLLIAIVVAIPFFLFTTVVGTFAAAWDPSVGINDVSRDLGFLGVAIAVMLFFSTFIYTLIYYAMVHFAATSALGGVGYYTNLLKTISIPLIVQFVLQIIIYVVMFALVGSSFANIDPVALEAAMRTGDTTFVPEINQNLGLITSMNGLISLVGLGILWWMTKRIGDNYEFGWFKGCFAQIIPFIAVVVLICVCGFVIPLLSN
ncbi:MAG: hypothetical protein AAF846_29475 [Chloroflexota bacterium]